MSDNKKNNGLSLVKTPDAQIQEALDRLVELELANFAGNLETARGFWRRFPELVEAPVFPEQLAAALVKERGDGPNDNCASGENVLDPDYRETLRPEAVELDRHQEEKKHVG